MHRAIVCLLCSSFALAQVRPRPPIEVLIQAHSEARNNGRFEEAAGKREEARRLLSRAPVDEPQFGGWAKWVSQLYEHSSMTAQARAILEGIAQLIAQAGGSARKTRFLALGTTLATNAVLEGKWARTGLITTAGFRDVLELARQRRPHYFNLDIPKPVPPASRACRVEVGGRIAFDGEEVAPLDEPGLRHAIGVLKEQKVEVATVNVVNVKGKEKRHGRFIGRRKSFKKAYVSLKGDGDINFVEGVA